MRPTKAKEYIKEVSQELGIANDAIEAAIEYYWREVRKQMSSLSHPRIHITNLGDFTVKHWKIDDKITRLEQWEENNKQKGLQQITARFKTAEILFDLKNMKKLVEEENQRKEFIKLHKKTTHESEKQHNQNLEKQKSDN